MPTQSPAVDPIQGLQLANALLTVENLQLKRAALDVEIARVQSTVDAAVKALEVPGYLLQRTPQGAIVYTPMPPVQAEEPAPKGGGEVT